MGSQTVSDWLYPSLSSTQTSLPQGGRLGSVNAAGFSQVGRSGSGYAALKEKSGSVAHTGLSNIFSLSGCNLVANALKFAKRDLSVGRSPPLRGRCHEVTEGGGLPHKKVPPLLRSNARRMRSAMTKAELKLWNELRAHRLMGLSFRRQLPIGKYIVDFARPECKLIVEVDGSQHTENESYDLARTIFLKSQGWQIVRFWNDDVLSDIDNVCTHILRLAERFAA